MKFNINTRDKILSDLQDMTTILLLLDEKRKKLPPEQLLTSLETDILALKSDITHIRRMLE